MCILLLLRLSSLNISAFNGDVIRRQDKVNSSKSLWRTLSQWTLKDRSCPLRPLFFTEVKNKERKKETPPDRLGTPALLTSERIPQDFLRVNSCASACLWTVGCCILACKETRKPHQVGHAPFRLDEPEEISWCAACVFTAAESCSCSWFSLITRRKMSHFRLWPGVLSEEELFVQILPLRHAFCSSFISGI